MCLVNSAQGLGLDESDLKKEVTTSSNDIGKLSCPRFRFRANRCL